MYFLFGRCEPCNALVCGERTEGDPPVVICKGCGAELTPIMEPATILKGKLRRPGMSKRKGRISEVRLAFQPQRNRDGILVRHERTTNYAGDWYSEKVTVCKSGEVIHQCEEPLSQHQGHGSAKGSEPDI